MEIEIEKRFVYLNLDVGFWNRHFKMDDPGTVTPVAGIYCFFHVNIPCFKPDQGHINWIKEAWGIVTDDDKLRSERIAYPSDGDHDPIPF
jgi:hypothetical protein